MTGTKAGAPAAQSRPRPVRSLQATLGWLHQNLFNTWYNALLTLISAWLIYKVAITVVPWGLTRAVFGTTAESCQGAQGACWSFVYHFFGLFMVGTYPYEQRWRILGVLLIVVALSAATLYRPWRGKRWLILTWIAALFPMFLMIRGSQTLGLPVVDSTQWGGLLLTVLLSVFGVGLAFPFSILLALGRRSKLPIVKALCVGYIELIRGVPLITILFMASVMLPLFFPPGFNLDKVLRAQIGIIMFSSAYLAEVVRGGLQAIPRGQEEAAAAMGLNYWQTMGLIVMPQALRIVIPPLVSTFIGLLKDTSLVAIISLIDLLGAAYSASQNPQWLGHVVEAYVFTGAVYWVICFSMSRYSQKLEQRFRVGQH